MVQGSSESPWSGRLVMLDTIVQEVGALYCTAFLSREGWGPDKQAEPLKLL
jgi:hypothetical protein